MLAWLQRARCSWVRGRGAVGWRFLHCVPAHARVLGSSGECPSARSGNCLPIIITVSSALPPSSREAARIRRGTRSVRVASKRLTHLTESTRSPPVCSLQRSVRWAMRARRAYVDDAGGAACGCAELRPLPEGTALSYLLKLPADESCQRRARRCHRARKVDDALASIGASTKLIWCDACLMHRGAPHRFRA
ncbi:hypothetical protein DAEQUDRAFT_568990 [Daedalea quercina L-15889]|uniref:Uncharacterized protein n=1 Tax=Daedalea quercina L-15889 TaxID=1314783 RepID=A0A165LVZ8_9APHY|nr:hypothetical protein DAEQUDRAFT_568990 [Daedalea quercina L-15889]